MFIRTVTAIVLIDLYMWLHEMPPHFATVVVACCGLTIVDIIFDKIWK